MGYAHPNATTSSESSSAACFTSIRIYHTHQHSSTLFHNDLRSFTLRRTLSYSFTLSRNGSNSDKIRITRSDTVIHTHLTAPTLCLQPFQTTPGSGNRKRKFGEEEAFDPSAAAAAASASATAFAINVEAQLAAVAKGGGSVDDFDADAAASGNGPPASKTPKRSRLSLAGLPSTLRERTNSLVSRGKTVRGMVRTVSARSLMVRRSARKKGNMTASREYFGSPGRAKSSSHLWCESLPEEDKERLAHMPRAELDRREAIHELVQGEDVFVTNLAHTINVYQKPLLHTVPGMTQAQLERIFANISVLFKLHEELNVCLQRSRRQDGDCPVGRILSQWLPGCAEAYKLYCANQPKSKYVLSVLKSNRRFREVDETARDLPQSNKKNLAALLDAPRVRLQNYRLLLQRILKVCVCDICLCFLYSLGALYHLFCIFSMLIV